MKEGNVEEVWHSNRSSFVAQCKVSSVQYSCTRDQREKKKICSLSNYTYCRCCCRIGAVVLLRSAAAHHNDPFLSTCHFTISKSLHALCLLYQAWALKRRYVCMVPARVGVRMLLEWPRDTRYGIIIAAVSISIRRCEIRE